MFSVVSVCLSVCLFVCQHDNFPAIKYRIMKLGSYLHCTKISPEFECEGQRSRSPGQKMKSLPFCAGVVLCAAVLVRHFVRQWPSWLGRPSVLRRWENQRMLSSCFDTVTQEASGL